MKELSGVVGRHGLVAEEIALVPYAWSAEDVTAPRALKATPFDWAVLALRAVPRHGVDAAALAPALHRPSRISPVPTLWPGQRPLLAPCYSTVTGSFMPGA